MDRLSRIHKFAEQVAGYANAHRTALFDTSNRGVAMESKQGALVRHDRTSRTLMQTLRKTFLNDAQTAYSTAEALKELADEVS